MPTNLYGPNDNYDLVRCHVLPALLRKGQLVKLGIKCNLGAIKEDEARHGEIPDQLLANLDCKTRAPIH